MAAKALVFKIADRSDSSEEDEELDETAVAAKLHPSAVVPTPAAPQPPQPLPSGATPIIIAPSLFSAPAQLFPTDLKINKIEEKLKALDSNFLVNVGTSSSEYAEASQAISIDPWNVNAWMTMIDEVDSGRAGNTSNIEIYLRFLDQFPLCAKVWKSLIDYYLDKDEIALAEHALSTCTQKCRNVDLWLSYVGLVKKKTVDKVSKHSEHYLNARKAVEAAFEKCLENIGTAHDSNAVWRKYVEFVFDWPESGPMEAQIKVGVLKGLLRRALIVPMDDLDKFWADYEQLEATSGEANSAELLAEFKMKYQHAKAAHRDRLRMLAKVMADRVAAPPAKSMTELHQLELWNKYIRSAAIHYRWVYRVFFPQE
jgi:hypothetical protein